MTILLNQARLLHNDSASTILQLKDRVKYLEEKSDSVAERFIQIDAEALPKARYCLGIRLTLEWYERANLPIGISGSVHLPNKKLRYSSLHHYCVFSDNILAASVVVNSTVTNSMRPHLDVFHLITDEVNYLPMKTWFSNNSFWGAIVEVKKVDGFRWLRASYVPVMKQLQDSETLDFHLSGNSDDVKTPIGFGNPKYGPLFNHMWFYIPDIYPALKKVVFLSDDVVVQKDLSDLFYINLKEGNVVGAGETCDDTSYRFQHHLNFPDPLVRAINQSTCGWACGMNLLDLEEWRKKNLTNKYHYWQGKSNMLPMEPLNSKWNLLGLGYTAIKPSVIRRAAVLHYNSKMKPWMMICTKEYKELWDRYVDYSHPMLQRCSMH